jgi:hypothetical protein
MALPISRGHGRIAEQAHEDPANGSVIDGAGTALKKLMKPTLSDQEMRGRR